MPTKMLSPEQNYTTASDELFYMKNLSLLTGWSHALSLRTIEEMEISGMQLGNGYFLLGLLHIIDNTSRREPQFLGHYTALAQQLLRRHLSEHFLCHIGGVGGDLAVLFCFPHAADQDSPVFWEAQGACRSFTARFQEQMPQSQFLFLLGVPFSGYAHICDVYRHLQKELEYRLFMGKFPSFLIQGHAPSQGHANPQYLDNDRMTTLAARMAVTIARRQRKEITALEDETLQALFSGSISDLAPVHFRLYVYLCALCKHLETRGLVDRSFTKEQDFFQALTTARSYHAFCDSFQGLIRSILQHYDARRPSSSASRAARLQQIHEYCLSHYMDANLTVSSLAELFGLSQPQLSSSYKMQYGCSLLHHINTLRINAVKELLTTTNKTQTEIALSCGFSNVTTMRRLFLRLEQQSPGQYRAG